MTQRYAVLLVICAVVGVAVGLPAVAAQETATSTETNDSDVSDGDGLGTQLTAFTQSSSAAANDSVESGMWRAGFEQSNASDRARLVTDRTGGLEARLERLRTQNETIQRQYENGTISEQAYVARQSRLNARIDALRTAVNETDEAAAETGVNDTRLERLKQNASRLSGPAVAGVARGLGGGQGEMPPPANNQTGERGPPTDAGNQSDGTGSGPGQSGDGPGQAGEADSNGGGPGGADSNGGGPGGADSNGSGGSGNSDRGSGDTGNGGGNGGGPDTTGGQRGN